MALPLFVLVKVFSVRFFDCPKKRTKIKVQGRMLKAYLNIEGTV